MAKLDLKTVQPYIDRKLISVQKHPNVDLYIYNYTPECQFTRSWDEVTTACRGLITDKEGNIIARPFKKFFNIEEVSDLPNESFEAHEKMDGSLGILYWIEGSVYPWIATRGSFTSDQAKRANKILMRKYAHCCEHLDKTKTYLFEIIYPENRIVVDYQDREELVLLAVIDTETGEEIDIYKDTKIVNRLGFPLARDFSHLSWSNLTNGEVPNEEGYVIRFKPSNLRVKVKFADYKRLHKLLTGVSSVDIWDVLRRNKGLESILNNTPDEFFGWVKEVSRDLTRQFQTKRESILAAYDEIVANTKIENPHTEDILMYNDYLKMQRVLYKELNMAVRKYDVNKDILMSLLKGMSKEHFIKAIWEDIKPVKASVFKIEKEV